jgi:hypothetical protein
MHLGALDCGGLHRFFTERSDADVGFQPRKKAAKTTAVQNEAFLTWLKIVTD